MNEPVRIALQNTRLRAEISEQGAELVRLQDSRGRDLLWDGDPAYWGWHAPLLFPIVGRVAGDRIHVEGQDYPMRQHGLARLSRFRRVDNDSLHCRLRLDADDETRKNYPFRFRLTVTYALGEDGLSVSAQVENLGSGVMPVAFGFHPAFRWPLPDAGDRTEHSLVFERPEPAPIRRLGEGLVLPGAQPSPVGGTTLALDEDLFREDAVIFDRPASRRVLYSGRGGTSIEIAFPDMPQLGLWSKPGAGFLCIEPWHGFASPRDFDGELRDKPGMALVEAGGSAVFGMQIGVREG